MKKPKRKPKRKRSSSAGRKRTSSANRKRSSPADGFRKQLLRWKADGQKLQKQYDKLKQRGEVQHIEIFELGFEPLLVEIATINVDHLPSITSMPSATHGQNDPA